MCEKLNTDEFVLEGTYSDLTRYFYEDLKSEGGEDHKNIDDKRYTLAAEAIASSWIAFSENIEPNDEASEQPAQLVDPETGFYLNVSSTAKKFISNTLLDVLGFIPVGIEVIPLYKAICSVVVLCIKLADVITDKKCMGKLSKDELDVYIRVKHLRDDYHYGEVSAEIVRDKWENIDKRFIPWSDGKVPTFDTVKKTLDKLKDICVLREEKELYSIKL